MWRRVLTFCVLLTLGGCGPKTCAMGVPNPSIRRNSIRVFEIPELYDDDDAAAVARDKTPSVGLEAYVDQINSEHAQPARAAVKPKPGPQHARITPASTPRLPMVDDEDHEDVGPGYNPYPEEPVYDPPLIRPRGPGYRDGGRRHRDDYVSLRDDHGGRTGQGNRHDRGDRSDRYDGHKADGRRGHRDRADRGEDGEGDHRRRRRERDCYR